MTLSHERTRPQAGTGFLTESDTRKATSASRQPMVSEALNLAAAEWAVFPLKGKHPLAAHGFHDASTDPDQSAVRS